VAMTGRCFTSAFLVAFNFQRVEAGDYVNHF